MIGDILMWFLERVIFRLFLMGVFLVIATPFILILAPFRKGGVRGGYASLIRSMELSIADLFN
jgi:hypothetical protein